MARRGSAEPGDDAEPLAKRPKTASEPAQWKVNELGELDPNPWTWHQGATAYVNELREAQPLKVGHAGGDTSLPEGAGVLIFPLKTYLHKRESNNRWLFVRSHAKQVWEEVLKNNFPRSAVIGNPGIGKSFSSAYFLKMLLEMGKAVVYEARQNDEVYIFLPPGADGENKGYIAYKVSLKKWMPQDCLILQEAKNYYFIDPGPAEGPSEPAQVAACTVIDASVDPHQLGEFRKIAEVFYIGAWLLEEVLAIREFLPVNGRVLTSEEVKEGYWHFGGVPRHIFATTAAKSLARKKAQNALKDENMVRDVWAKGVETLGTRDDDKPPSAIFMLVPVDNLESASEMFQIEPHGFRPFADSHVALVSEWVQRALVKQYWRDVQATLNRRTFQTAVGVGWLFEDAAHLTLARGGQFHFRDLRTKSEGKVDLPPRVQTIGRGGVREFLAQALRPEFKGQYLVPENRKMPILDAAEGGTNEVYQITIDEKHRLQCNCLRAMLEGYPQKQILLIWVVTPALFAEFQARPLPDDLKDRVRQLVLKLEPVLPSTTYGVDEPRRWTQTGL